MTTILKGDTSGTLTISLAEGYDYSGKTLHLSYQGCSFAFTDVAAGGTVQFAFAADHTAPMALGPHPVTLWLSDATGTITALPTDYRINVTDDPAEVYTDGVIAIGAHGILYGITDLPDRYTTADVVSKIREILTRGGAALCACLCLSAFGDNALTLNTARLDAVYNDQSVVTNVHLDVQALTNGWTFGESMDLTDATNYANTVAQSATNYAKGVAVSATNYTDGALAQFSTTGEVFRALSTGGNNWWIDSTGRVWQVTYGDDWALEVTLEPGASHTNYPPVTRYPFWDDGSYYTTGWVFEIGHPEPFGNENPYATQLSKTVYYYYGQADTDVYYVTYTFSRSLSTNLVGTVATSADIPTTYVQRVNGKTGNVTISASDLGAASTSDVQAVSITLSNLYGGSNVIAQVTNYNSQVHAPKLSLLQLDEGEYKTVWAETNGLARTIAEAKSYTDGATNALDEVYAPKAWSRTTSGMGAEVPDEETTWITTPTTVISGGYEWAKTVTSAGALWFLTTNGMNTFATNNTGFLDIAATDGTSIFRIEKTDSVLVGVDAGGISVNGTTATISIPVVSTDHPYLRYTPTLSPPITWYKEEENTIPSGVTVTWSGSSGAWVCTVATSASSGFFMFEALQEGSTKIVNGGAVDMSEGIYYNGNVYYPEVSGDTLIFRRR